MIRLARVTDTDAVMTVLRRSITELCVEDHRNDPGVLAAWLENKTAENVRAWIQSPRTFMVVAEVGGTVSGVASVGITGRILLCYLLPEVQSTGVGRELLAAIESEALHQGLRELSLESTKSARGFYSKHGYHPKDGSADSTLLSKLLTT